MSLSYVDGYIFLERVSWENYNESGDLKSQIEKYKERYGYYPESVHVDQIYRTRENLKWLSTSDEKLLQMTYSASPN